MPVFYIQYTSPRTDHVINEETEWVTDSDWDADRTRKAFEARFPDVAIVRFQQITTCL